MTWDQFTTWAKSWAAYFRDKLAAEQAAIALEEDQITRIENTLNQILQEIQTMSAQTDVLTAEVAQVVNVLTSATPLIDAAVAAEAQLASLLAGEAPDNAAVQAATDQLTAARTAFSAEVAKLTPAATTPATGS